MADEPGTASGRAANASWVGAGLLVAVFYFWTAFDGRLVPRTEGDWPDFYNLQAEAFRRGYVHLPVDPAPGLFQLPDPYEPSRNAPLRLVDASLYRGRYYAYFGVVPVVVLYLPWQILGLGKLPDGAAALVFALAGLTMWALLLRALFRRCLPRSSAWGAAALLVFGIANVVPFVLRGIYVYEVAVVGGWAFTGGAAWGLFTAGVGGRRVPRLALGSLCAGLATGCRPNLLLGLPFLFALALPAFRAKPGRGRAALALLGPISVVLVALGAYNLARFGSWTEFGTRYQLIGSKPSPWFNPWTAPRVLRLHFLTPPRLEADLPFVTADAGARGGADTDGVFLHPQTVGLLWQAPLVLGLLLLPWLPRGAPVPDRTPSRSANAALALGGLAIAFGTAFAFGSGAMRYEVDFASLLLLPALVAWGLFLQGPMGNRPRWTMRLAIGVLATWSILAGFALSLAGASGGLPRFNPPLYESLRNAFEPLRVAVGRMALVGGRETAAMRVAFPLRLAAEREPFVTSGTVGRYDALWIRQVVDGIFAFELTTAGGSTHVSPPQRFVPGRFYDVQVRFDHVRRSVTVLIDGKATVALAGRVEVPQRNRLWLGRGPRGSGAWDLGQFSGILVPKAMIEAGAPGLEALPAVLGEPAILTMDAQIEPPGKAGLLWLPATADGARLFADHGWRWVPCPFVERVRVAGRLSLSGPAPNAIEPLFTWGTGDAWGGVFLRRRPSGRASFGYALGGHPWTVGAEGDSVPLLVGVPQSLSITVDRAARNVSVEYAGRAVLNADAKVAPMARGSLRIAASPDDRPLGAGRLQGTVDIQP